MAATSAAFVRRQHEPRPTAAGALAEQPPRFGLEHRLDRPRSAARREATSGGTGNTRSPLTCSASRLVTSTLSSRAVLRAARRPRARQRSTCSKLSSTRRTSAVAQHTLAARRAASTSVAPLDAQRAGDGGEHLLGLALGAQVDEEHPVVEPVDLRSGGLDGQAGLAGPARSVSVTSRTSSSPSSAPSSSSAASRPRTSRWRPAGSRRAVRRRSSPWIASKRSVRSTARSSSRSSRSSVGVAERLVGRAVLAFEPAEHLRQPRLHLRRRSLHVDEPGHSLREHDSSSSPEIVHVGGDPAVALPVDADEHVGLREVRAVQRPRRVGSSAELEHDRREPKLLDRRPSRLPLVCQLAERRGDEDAEALVGRSDGRVRA